MARQVKHPPSGYAILAWIGAMIGVIILMMIVHFSSAHARDLGQWETTDSTLRDWYQGLMQPDHPASSCCGEADAYFCDDYGIRNGKPSCVVTDDRPDEPRNRPHIDVGTVIEIPQQKLKWDRGNPTGHGVVFMSYAGYVFCYVQGGGV